jgi:hypothetical protein
MPAKIREKIHANILEGDKCLGRVRLFGENNANVQKIGWWLLDLTVGLQIGQSVSQKGAAKNWAWGGNNLLKFRRGAL